MLKFLHTSFMDGPLGLLISYLFQVSIEFTQLPFLWLDIR